MEAIFVARDQPDGSFTGAGSIELGLHRELVELLDERLGALRFRRRRSVAWYHISGSRQRDPRRAVRRAENVALSRALGRGGFWRWLWIR